MKQNISTSEELKNIDFTPLGFEEEQYENIHFISCNFHEAEGSSIEFIDCVFEDCNLSLMKTQNTDFKNVQFINCKLTGINFSECNTFLFQVSFSGCDIKLANFEKTKLTETLFENCDLSEAYFAEANLGKAVFENCNLSQAIFYYTNLTKANFTSAYNYTINPDENTIKKAKFSLAGLPGLLLNFDIEIL